MSGRDRRQGTETTRTAHNRVRHEVVLTRASTRAGNETVWNHAKHDMRRDAIVTVSQKPRP